VSFQDSPAKARGKGSKGGVRGGAVCDKFVGGNLPDVTQWHVAPRIPPSDG